MRRRRIGVASALTASLALGACGGAAPVASHRTTRHVSGRVAGPPSTTTTTDPAAAPSVVGYAAVPSVAVYDAPGGQGAPRVTLSNPNNLGAPLVLLIVASQGGWDQVMLPMRPNGSTGWVSDASLTRYSDDVKVRISIGGHSLDLLRRGQPFDHFTVAVGSADSPTPPGSFFVTELLKSPDPSGPYGPYAFGLSDFSNTYTEFDGGPGQIAIHGTNQPSLIGQAVSHGCIRLDNASVQRLVAELPVGSPVEIGA